MSQALGLDAGVSLYGVDSAACKKELEVLIHIDKGLCYFLTKRGKTSPFWYSDPTSMLITYILPFTVSTAYIFSERCYDKLYISTMAAHSPSVVFYVGNSIHNLTQLLSSLHQANRNLGR